MGCWTRWDLVAAFVSGLRLDRFSNDQTEPFTRSDGFRFDSVLFRRISVKSARQAGPGAVSPAGSSLFLLKTPVIERVAERAGFEPARGVNPYAISSRAHSSTLAPLRTKAVFGAGRWGRYVWAGNIIACPWVRSVRRRLTALADTLRCRDGTGTSQTRMTCGWARAATLRWGCSR